MKMPWGKNKEDDQTPVLATKSTSAMPAAVAEAQDVKEKAFLLSGPVAAVGLIVLSLVLVLRSCTVDDTEYATIDQVTEHMSNTTQATNFATDYVSLWLAGQGPANTQDADSPHQAALNRRTSTNIDTVALPSTPYRVNSTRGWLAPDGWMEVGSGTLWRIVVEASVVQPGASRVSDMFFQVDVAEGPDKTFRVYALPRPIARTETPIAVRTAYRYTVEKDSAMFSAAQRYASAYLTPDGDGAGLGTTTGPEYHGDPITGSIWRDATVTDVSYYDLNAAAEGDSSVDPATAEADDQLEVLITVRASTSTSSFTTLQIPVTMQMMSNGQWVVAKFSERTFFDGIDPL